MMNRMLYPNVLIVFAMLLLLGCSEDSTEAKTSHFEHDHNVAEHWPDGLADVAVKLRERMSGDDPSNQVRSEMEELVSWTAEVAADTNLTEADWLPLYQATESLSANLRAAKGEWTDDNRKQIESLCQLVDQAASKIPDQLPNLVEGSS